MYSYRPQRIIVQKDSWQDALTIKVLDYLPEVEVRVVAQVETALEEIYCHADSRTAGKRVLVLTRNRGCFLEKCPGAGAEICCDYYVLNFAANCPFECSYCILQSYLNTPALIVFTNEEDLYTQVQERLSKDPSRTFRIGTGELADSMVLEDITGYASRLVTFFASLSNGILELKTKSDKIESLKSLGHNNHTVVSWSVNSKFICRTEELKAASLEARLQAAHRCQNWGYRVGFHFDPLVYYEGWEKDYREVVREIFQTVDPSGIAWMSLGCLRFTPDLRRIIRERFPKSIVPYGEFIPGHHGKLRYFRPIRQEMYAKMHSWIREWAPDAFVYLCMESRRVWEKSLGTAPKDTCDLAGQMDALVRL
jgi:spore photoproduct lyase